MFIQCDKSRGNALYYVFIQYLQIGDILLSRSEFSLALPRLLGEKTAQEAHQIEGCPIHEYPVEDIAALVAKAIGEIRPHRADQSIVAEIEKCAVEYGAEGGNHHSSPAV